MELENLRKTKKTNLLIEVMSQYIIKFHYQIPMFKNNVLYIFISNLLNIFNNNCLLNH